MTFAKDGYDTIVIGAGPAGCSAAAVAARAGLSVLVLERDRAPRFKIGESLMPGTYPAFQRMGVLEAMQSSRFVRKYSVQFYARSGKASSPFYFRDLYDDERADTWQVLRADFDQLLLDNAARQGAECHRGVTVREVLFDRERARGVRVELPDGGKREVACRVLIDASGQSTVLGKTVALGRIDYGLQHAAYFSHFRGARRDPGIDQGATLVLQTVPGGDAWFWYIPLADDVVSVGVVGGTEYLKRAGKLPHETFFDEVRRCPEVEDRLRGSVQCRPVTVLRDFSYKYERNTGDGWILIGDAWSFIDPIYSSGVFLALSSGVMAADAAARACRTGDLSGQALGAFRPRLEDAVSSILGLVHAFYDPRFSFGQFMRAYPQHRDAVTKILIGDVFDWDFTALFADMATHLADETGEALVGAEVPSALG